MKILLVNKAYYPHLGGIETVVRQLAEGMQRRGHEVTILCFGDRDFTERISNVEVRRIRPMMHIGSAPIGFHYAVEFFRLSKWADVINLHSPNPMGELALLLSPLFPGKKIICAYHGDAQRPRFLLSAYDFIMRRFFRRSNVIVVSNPPLLESSRLLKEGSFREKTRIIPYGVRTENYFEHQTSDIKEARRLLASLPTASYKVMYAGRMVYYKGLKVLLEAFRTIKEKRHSISAFLVGSGIEENNVRDFITDNALENDMLIIPHQSESVYRALFSLADCFVLPSTHQTEAFGIVLAEAMASGLPIISTELGTGTSWVNLNGETGIVVPPGDSIALAEAIVYLANNDVERKAMATESLARAKCYFEECTMLEAYDEMFQTIISPH
jgi:rhamnosyl/mannosyltransferase